MLPSLREGMGVGSKQQYNMKIAVAGTGYIGLSIATLLNRRVSRQITMRAR